MRVLLVYSNQSRELVPAPPVGLSYVASATEAAGHQVKLLDLAFADDIPGKIAQAIEAFAPEVVGLSIRNIDNVIHQRFDSPLQLLQAQIAVIREKARTADGQPVPLVLGGPAISILAEKVLPLCGADYAVVCEGEAVFPALLAALAKGASPARLPGLCYWQDGVAKRNSSTLLPGFVDSGMQQWIDWAPYQHAGEVLEENGDCFGDAVNVAARMAGVANGGQIITTAWTVSRLSPLLRHGTREVAMLPVKGKRDEMQVCEVVWQTGDQVTMFASRDTRLAAETVLRLTVDQRTLVMGSELPVVQIGRDVANHVVVPDVMASRLHGRIERRGGKYYYVDLSTNGTYITLDGDSETLLRRDQAMLRGRGTICCGHSAAEDGATTLQFALETRI